MMLRVKLYSSALVLALSTPLWAQPQTAPVRDNGFSYTYGQLAYDNWDFDRGLDLDVLTGEGSFALDEHVFLRGGLSFYDGDIDSPGDDDIDGNRLYAGVGFHTPLQRGLDGVITGDIIRDDNDFDDEEFGYALRAGVRHATAEQLELSGGAIYENVYDGEFGVYGQALVKLSEVVDVGLRVRLTDDQDNYGLFGRYNF